MAAHCDKNTSATHSNAQRITGLCLLSAVITSVCTPCCLLLLLWFFCRHQLFVDMVRQDKQALEAAAQAAAAVAAKQQQQVKGTRPADLPVYGQTFMSKE